MNDIIEGLVGGNDIIEYKDNKSDDSKTIIKGRFLLKEKEDDATNKKEKVVAHVFYKKQ